MFEELLTAVHYQYIRRIAHALGVASCLRLMARVVLPPHPTRQHHYWAGVVSFAAYATASH
jgi:hypothetical protein